MSLIRKATDAVAEKVKTAARDWTAVTSLRPFEVENFLGFLSILGANGVERRELKRTAKFNRQKAVHNLNRVIRADEGTGPMLVFWLSVSTTMTQLGKVNVNEFLRQMHQQSLPYSVELASQVKMLLHTFYQPSSTETPKSRVTGDQTTDGIGALPSQSSTSDPLPGPSAPSAEDVGNTRNVEAIASSREEATNSTRRYEIPINYLAEFLRRLNGDSALEMTVQHNNASEAPFISLKECPNARLYLNHDLSAILLHRIVGAETEIRENGTIALIGCKQSQ